MFTWTVYLFELLLRELQIYSWLPSSGKNNETTKNTSIRTPDTVLPTTQRTPDTLLPTNTIIYIGVGVILAVVVIVQAICFYVYIKNVKATRHTIETIIRSNGTGRSDNSAVRYSMAPELNAKRTYSADSNLYEIIPETDTGKKPPPPPLETLPRKKLPPPPTIGPPKPLITERIRVNSTSSSTSAESLRREKTIRAPIREPKPAINRPKLPLPNELPGPLEEIPSWVGEVKTDRVSNVSLPTMSSSLPRRPKRMPPPPMLPPKPHVRNDSDDSDDEWEIEQLKPINLYNI